MTDRSQQIEADLRKFIEECRGWQKQQSLGHTVKYPSWKATADRLEAILDDGDAPTPTNTWAVCMACAGQPVLGCDKCNHTGMVLVR